jgi:hypothetical protein
MTDIHENLERFRDYFLMRKEPEKVDQCNVILDELDKNFYLCEEDVKALYNYFMHCGYIDQEGHERVHKIINRLFAFYDAKVITNSKLQ